MLQHNSENLKKKAEGQLYFKGGTETRGRKAEKLKAPAHKVKVTFWGIKTSDKMTEELSSMLKIKTCSHILQTAEILLPSMLLP